MAKYGSEYADWFYQQETMTQEQAANHRNWVNKMVPVHKQLRNALHNELGGTGSFSAGNKFSRKEAELLHAAMLLLDASIVPVALIPEIEKPKKLLMLPRRAGDSDYDRRNE